jgi:hypothetical protein
MAAFGAAVIPPGQLVYRASGLTISPLTVSSFGSAVVPRVSLDSQGTPGAAEKPPGDYPMVAALKEVAVVRERLYEAPAGTTAYVRYALFANNSGAARVVRIWLGGRLIEPGLALAIGQAKSDNPLWILRPGERLEASADGTGVDCTITGIEEVRG